MKKESFHFKQTKWMLKTDKIFFVGNTFKGYGLSLSLDNCWANEIEAHFMFGLLSYIG